MFVFSGTAVTIVANANSSVPSKQTFLPLIPDNLSWKRPTRYQKSTIIKIHNISFVSLHKLPDKEVELQPQHMFYIKICKTNNVTTSELGGQTGRGQCGGTAVEKLITIPWGGFRCLGNH